MDEQLEPVRFQVGISYSRYGGGESKDIKRPKNDCALLVLSVVVTVLN